LILFANSVLFLGKLVSAILLFFSFMDKYTILLEMNITALRCYRLKFPLGGTSFAVRAKREIEGSVMNKFIQSTKTGIFLK